MHHSSCQTDGHHVNEQGLHQLFLDIQAHGNKTTAMVNDKIQQPKQEFDAAYARQAQQHEASIQQREDVIAELRPRTTN